MNMVDDPTSTVEAYMGDAETIWAAVHVLRQWIEKYGVPLALYTDWKNVYVREPTEKEQLHDTRRLIISCRKEYLADHNARFARGQRNRRTIIAGRRRCGSGSRRFVWRPSAAFPTTG